MKHSVLRLSLGPLMGPKETLRVGTLVGPVGARAFHHFQGQPGNDVMPLYEPAETLW